ncbi:hypothetical protein IV203_009343 [Nitzschia inconspicua]|uniref:SET domain-containing protein n=1 Tax=Nitzschia inconspicua TaxID=303405 RepID=A0A9K3PQA7_9STRA|nr:hypothetical protein IV203_009343 [Nitzschia inconspicua]
MLIIVCNIYRSNPVSSRPSHCYQLTSPTNHSSRQQQHQDNQNYETTDSCAEKSAAAAERYLQPFSLGLVDFPTEDGSGAVRGVQSLVDRPKPDGNSYGPVVFLEIPLEDTIWSSGSIFQEQKEDTDESWMTTMRHVTSDEEERLAIELLRRRKNNDPYVTNVFPRHHLSIWTLPQDLWDEMVTSKCLPRCYMESFRATRDRVRGVCQRLVDAQKGHETISFSFEECLWAFSMVRSRSVAVPELQPSRISTTTNDLDDVSQVPLAIIPGLDLLNHQFASGTLLQLLEEVSGESTVDKAKHKIWALSSTKPIKSGDQVFLSYGDDKDNWKLLLTYGFSVPSNPNSIVFWTWQDLLEAANKVRPNIFQDRIVAQLMDHPQLRAYTTLSENRATFSFDAKGREPRESLSNGLTMLSDLVVQLGQPKDDRLSPDVLDELIQSRLLALEVCQRELKRIHNSLCETKSNLEWHAFVEQLCVAAKQEEHDLGQLSIS